MSVREHRSKHETIGDLPLVTESATVTDVTTVDRDRRAEVRAAVRRWLEGAGVADRYELGTTPREWDRLRTALAEDGRAELARRVATLAERAGRPKPMLVRTRFRADEPFDYLAGQYGDLVLGEQSPRDLVFLATGTGVAPFKGMIDYLFEEGLDVYEGRDGDGDRTRRDVWLFLGAAWEDDLPYLEAFRERARERENFHFVPTLSREAFLSDWDGEVDYVQHALLKHVDETAVTAPVGQEVERWLRGTSASGVDARIAPGNVDVYACGINAMVYSLVEATRKIGVPEERIDSEGIG